MQLELPDERSETPHCKVLGRGTASHVACPLLAHMNGVFHPAVGHDLALSYRHQVEGVVPAVLWPSVPYMFPAIHKAVHGVLVSTPPPPAPSVWRSQEPCRRRPTEIRSADASTHPVPQT